MAIKTAKPDTRKWRVVNDTQSPAINARVGEMCVAWAALEYVLFRFFYFLSGLPTPIARSIFYSQNTSLGRINLLHSTYTPLLTRKNRPLAASVKIKEFLDGLAPLANERNGFVHDP
jgi:hypothetical protein